MSGFMLENEALVRLGGFTGVLVLMLAWEAAAPRRPAAAGPHARRLTNLALVAVDTALLRLLLPAAAVMAAAVATAPAAVPARVRSTSTSTARRSRSSRCSRPSR